MKSKNNIAITEHDITITELDRIAHQLYVKKCEDDNERFALSLTIFTIGSMLKLHEEYYDKAELILRKKKIKKLYHGSKRD